MGRFQKRCTNSGCNILWHRYQVLVKLHLEIVRRCDRAKGFRVLPKRWIVERTFGWLYNIAPPLQRL